MKTSTLQHDPEPQLSDGCAVRTGGPWHKHMHNVRPMPGWGQSKEQTKSKSCKDLHNNTSSPMSASVGQKRSVAGVCNRNTGQLRMSECDVIIS